MVTKQKRDSILTGELSAVDNIQAFLDKIKDDKHNIFLHVNSQALDDAKKVDDKIKNKTAGKLAGLAIAVKSNICVKGLVANCASKTLESFTAPYDADVITRIRAEDGIIIGMVNMDEFASGISGETSAYGPTINPAAPDRVPGGSSSGSAAAVAAGLCDLALGSDTGGSIRNPASHCGVVGIKPSYGRVSRFGLIDLSMTLDQIGPLAPDVYGAALLLEVISGNSDNDPSTKNDAVDNYSSFSQTSVRVGFDKQVEALCSQKEILETVMQKVGDTTPITIQHIDLAVQTYYPLVYVEFFSGTRKFDGRRFGLKIEESCGDEVLRRILGGREISRAEFAGKYYRKALAVQRYIVKEFAKAFDTVDVIVLPTTPKLPTKIGEKLDVQDAYAYDAFTIPANLAGICAGVIPAGTVDGVPVGLQVFAKDEQTLFSFLGNL